MTSQKQIKTRNEIIGLLHTYLRRPLIMLNQASDRPEIKGKTDYPFMGYRVITDLIKDREMGIYGSKSIPSNNPLWDIDKLESVEFQPQMTISFTAYDRDLVKSKELAIKAWEYLNHIGYYDLSAKNIVVVECQNVSGRDILEVDDYERRHGFDARFRYTYKIDRRNATIENYDIKNNLEK